MTPEHSHPKHAHGQSQTPRQHLLPAYMCLRLPQLYKGWSPANTQWSSVQDSSVTQSCLTLCNSMDTALQASLSITNSWSLLKQSSIESVMPSNRLIVCHPLLLPTSIFPSIRVFSNESVLRIRWPKEWSFSFSISPSNEYSGLISFRMDRLDLLVVQQTLQSLLQNHISKASILQHSGFFTVQLPIQLNTHTWLLEKTQLWLDGPLLAK